MCACVCVCGCVWCVCVCVCAWLLLLLLELTTSPDHAPSQTTALLHYPSVHPQTLSVLQSQVRAVIGQLPADLQSCLRPAFMAPPS